MKTPIHFEVQDRLWEQTLHTLGEQTDREREELQRGLLFMMGRRAGRMLQQLIDDPPEELLEELDIAILHSRQEK